ncbi:MAG: adenylate/guanylate cyclase domain-containing protein [Diaphorobacter sp.]|nr:adenylate/guanylate cyclase domain-containing protein [Diaphorobacter sp.]
MKLEAPVPVQHNKVVLVMDLVESVRLMAANEAFVVSAWHGFLQHAQDKVLPACSGRLVKSLGDGLLAEFDRSADAVKAAYAMHRYFDRTNERLPPEARLHLRAGIHATHLYIDTHDVFGHGVNLAARVTALAAPGETVITASVRDTVVDGIDGEVEDMGESYLKHWPEPVRTWRIWPANDTAPVARAAPQSPVHEDLRPTIAVIPFQGRGAAPEHQVVGELLADGVIGQISRSHHLRVISRLSTAAFRDREIDLVDIQTRLDAGYVLSGSYVVMGDRIVVMAELTDARRSDVVWADRLTGEVMDLLQPESQLILQIVDAATQALLDNTVQRSLILPLPQLESNTLLLGGIALMHRSTARDLDRSRELLDAVTDRHRRVASPWAWLSKWHILQVVQGRCADPGVEFRRAIEAADRALDLEPNSSMALAIKGHAMCHLGGDLDASRRLLTDATQVNPNDPMAWLYSGFWSTMWGNPEDAVSESDKARALSPMDPQKFYLDMLAANSYLVANRHEEAIALCVSSLKRNRYHASTLRVLLTAQVESNRIQDAQETYKQIRAIQPDLTLRSFLAYSSQSTLRIRGAAALKAMGLPD